MTEETRQQIIATDMRAMPENLIQDYTSSAHEIEGDARDIRAFLPRYLALTAADMDVDRVGVGTVFHRFGKAIRHDAAFLTPQQTQSYHRIASLMIAHFGWREVRGHDDITTPFYLIDAFLTGGVPTVVIFAAMDALFDQADVGVPAFVDFCQSVTHTPKRMDGSYGVNMFGIGWAPQQVRDDFAAWLRGDAMTQRLHAVFLSDDLNDEESREMDHAMTVFAGMDGSVFPNHQPDAG